MMNKSEKTATKRGIGIIDVLVVITLIACIAGTFIHYKIYEKNHEVITDDKCLVSVLISGVDADLAESYSEGDKFYYKDGELLGTVVEVTHENAAIYYTNAKNEVVKGSDESRKDVTLIVEVKGELSDVGFKANGTDYIASGMEIDAFTPKVSGKGLIFEVKKQTD